MAKERTFGYHPTEEPRIFEIDRGAGETLPAGWADTPAKFPPKPAETAATARIDELTAELATLKDMVRMLQRPAPKSRRRNRGAANDASGRK